MMFGTRLSEAMAAHGPVCVGIDPHDHLLEAWGLPLTAAGVREFALRTVTELAGTVAAVKPQSAFFERFGSAGVAALEETLAACRERGLITILDVKRGDIGSTMAAYANAWSGDSPLAADAVTASPYLGFGSLQPLLDTAQTNGRGVFVLAATSNPEGATVQRAQTGGRTVAQSIVDAAAAVNRERLPGPGSVGVVVGATLAEPPDVSALGGPVLVPGVGAQGGRPEALGGLGGAHAGQLLPAVSREVLRAGPDVTEMRAAAEKFRDAVAYLA